MSYILLCSFVAKEFELIELTALNCYNITFDAEKLRVNAANTFRTKLDKSFLPGFNGSCIVTALFILQLE